MLENPFASQSKTTTPKPKSTTSKAPKSSGKQSWQLCRPTFRVQAKTTTKPKTTTKQDCLRQRHELEVGSVVFPFSASKLVFAPIHARPPRLAVPRRPRRRQAPFFFRVASVLDWDRRRAAEFPAGMKTDLRVSTSIFDQKSVSLFGSLAHWIRAADTHQSCGNWTFLQGDDFAKSTMRNASKMCVPALGSQTIFRRRLPEGATCQRTWSF